MNKTLMPESQNWDSFWSRKEALKFSKVSWSKRRIIDILDRYAEQGQCVLDAGCGSGFFSKYFIDKGMETYSLDYAQEALNIAREVTEGRTNLVQGNLLETDLRELLPCKMDIIFTDGLFEHFSSQRQDRITENFKSVLKPGGVIATFVPNRWSPWELIRPFYMPGIDEKPFTLRELRDLQVRNQLRVLEQGGINTVPFAFSPDKFFGPYFGMLLYTISQPHD